MLGLMFLFGLAVGLCCGFLIEGFLVWGSFDKIEDEIRYILGKDKENEKLKANEDLGGSVHPSSSQGARRSGGQDNESYRRGHAVPVSADGSREVREGAREDGSKDGFSDEEAKGSDILSVRLGYWRDHIG